MINYSSVDWTFSKLNFILYEFRVTSHYYNILPDRSEGMDISDKMTDSLPYSFTIIYLGRFVGFLDKIILIPLGLFLVIINIELLSVKLNE